MKKLLFVFLLTFPIMVFGQSMNIKWEDREGREFSVNSHSGKFTYSMVPGDNLYYNTGSYTDTGPKNTIKSIGSVDVYWNTGSYTDTGEKGTIKSVGGLTINYNTGSYRDSGPKGTIKNTSGSVN